MAAQDHDTQRELGRLTRDLEQALERFRADSRLATLAEKEVPDARHRLEHVLRLTDDVAHRTLESERVAARPGLSGPDRADPARRDTAGR